MCDILLQFFWLIDTFLLCRFWELINRRMPKCNSVLQAEKDLFQHEIRPNLPEKCHFLTFFRTLKSSKTFGHWPVKTNFVLRTQWFRIALVQPLLQQICELHILYVAKFIITLSNSESAYLITPVVTLKPRFWDNSEVCLLFSRKQQQQICIICCWQYYIRNQRTRLPQ